MDRVHRGSTERHRSHSSRSHSRSRSRSPLPSRSPSPYHNRSARPKQSSEVIDLRAEAQSLLLRADLLDKKKSSEINNDSSNAENKRLSDELTSRWKPIQLRSKFRSIGVERKYREVRDVMCTFLSSCDGSSKDPAGSFALGIEKCVKILKNCCIADLHGWDIIDELEHGPIYDNAEEEKEVRKAKKRVEDRKEKQSSSRTFYSSSYSKRGPYSNKGRGGGNNNNFKSNGAIPSLNRPPSDRGCFKCGGNDHFKRDCPRAKPTFRRNY